jgi:hypothetical protein
VVVEGLLWTLRSVGVSIAIKETMRRAFGWEYSWQGIKVRDAVTFRLLRWIAVKGFRMWAEGEYWCVAILVCGNRPGHFLRPSGY